jgi:type IV pilus assembly protein PilY1
MMKNNTSLRYTFSLIAALSIPVISVADDTEIYFDINQISEDDAYNPNVLFILNTSGSMTSIMTTVDFGGDIYDSAQTYGSSATTNIYSYTEDWTSFVTIPRSKISCQAMLNHLDDPNNAASPIYTGQAAAYSNNGGPYWLDINSTWWPNYNNLIECEEDENNHGQTDASTDLYTAVAGAANSTTSGVWYSASGTGYTAAAGSSVDWSLMEARNYVTANYHDFIQNHTTSDSRSNVMKDAAKNLVDNFDDMNIGLMRFDGGNGGYVVHHFSDIDTDATNIKNKIDSLGASGVTPLAETLWEAHRYYAGLSVDYGTKSTSAAVSNGNYNTPAENSDVVVDCQSNYVVYLTDGQPVSDSGRDTQISGLGQGTCSHTGGTTANSTCLDEMSAYMAEYDYNSNLGQTQEVRTYTIAFGLDLPLLQAAATATDDPNGGYYTANNSTELNDVFDKILTNIEQTSTTFVAPAVSVNAFNSLQNKNEIYYALFEPNLYPRWFGNVKKYKINSKGAILDAKKAPDGFGIPDTEKDNDVINDITGYFDSSAYSFWTDGTSFPADHPTGDGDGYQVNLGGAASRLDLDTARTVYTLANTPDRTGNIDINLNANNLISETTKTDLSISHSLFGIDETQTSTEIADDRAEIIDWILGIDVKDVDEDLDFAEASRFMSDPLHSRPIVVTYGGTEDDPDDTLFSIDNGGAFRAIETKEGKELFAFIPPELLKNQKLYMDNDATNVTDNGKSKFIYGLDGPLTIWHEESNDPDIIVNSNGDDGDRVYAYFGMRRGGSNYYAMNVTDRDDPQLMWTIFGSGNTTPTARFSDLGQTWSEPKLQKVLWGCGTSCDPTNPNHVKDVLFFAGGYNPEYDDETNDAADINNKELGAAIYMVDAEDGSLLWSVGRSNTHDLVRSMNSIPGDLTVADINGDGAADVLFAIDILGHVWRIDFNPEDTSLSNFASAGEIADLSDSNAFRRFYVGPTVSLSQKRGRAPFFVITVGSGYMAHPLDDAPAPYKDRVYAIFDKHVFSPEEDTDGNPIYTLIDTAQLANLTELTSTPADPATNTGFYKEATITGEKFLRRAITQQGITVYTSYVPDGETVTTNNNCGTAQLGSSRLFAIDFVTGASLYTTQYIPLKHPGIASEPVTLLIPDENDGSIKKVLCVGTECFGPDEDENPFGEVTTQILYWRENIQ